MTSDAKIGLLLGLVFIFIIAFIINGLPSLRPEPNSNELTMEMTQFGDQPQGAGATEQMAFEGLTEEPTLPAGPIDQQQQAFAIDHGSLFEPAGDFVSDSESTGIGSGGFETIIPRPRFELADLDRSSESTDNSAVATDDTLLAADRILIRPPGQIELQPADIEAARQSGHDVSDGSNPEETVVVRPPTVSPIATHKVASGETLASIAKKYYGGEEGNRIVNVDRIFNANKGVLDAKDKVVVGQKLVIPALPGSDTPTTTIRKPAKPRPTLSTGQKWYVVKEGDSLWKIASSQLGKGSRSGEIQELNGDTITNENVVAIGMRLRLPTE